MKVKDILARGNDYYLPNLSVDMVIIGYREQQLHCLLLKMGQRWMLPGGYVGQDESVNQTVERVLKERTGLNQPHLKFLSVFGESDRKFDQEFKAFFKDRNLDWREDLWINIRFVTLAYYSLVNINTTHPTLGELDDAIDWHPMDALPEMWLDHATIAQTARNRLKRDIQHELVTYRLLPDAFTMPQLHQLHQVILEEPLDRSRFQKKMLASAVFERLPQLKQETPGRNPYQYRIKEEEE
ncbi:MAG TPA: hypothetical protein DCR93_36575 [Cytophagales bacterium]|nr:hypothetical protein [Cytophagales bacterium]